MESSAAIRPIRQTNRNLTQENASFLSRWFERMCTTVACLCGPHRPPSIIILTEDDIYKDPFDK